VTKPDWQEVGQRIKNARLAIRPTLSAREAAKRADMSTTYWQDLERGSRSDGGRHNPSDVKLADAARVVGLDPVPLFDLIGRTYTEDLASPETGPLPAALSGKISRLSERDRRAVERLVDEMLGPD
jgi:transcriptional regulator with XRE-family HTH domain